MQHLSVNILSRSCRTRFKVNQRQTDFGGWARKCSSRIWYGIMSCVVWGRPSKGCYASSHTSISLLTSRVIHNEWFWAFPLVPYIAYGIRNTSKTTWLKLEKHFILLAYCLKTIIISRVDQRMIQKLSVVHKNVTFNDGPIHNYICPISFLR